MPFFDAIRGTLFGGHMTQAQVDGTSAIMTAFYAAKLTDQRCLAYMLATAFHETARTMQPIEEIGKGRGRAYGHPAGLWHQVYDGRGDVQLTWQTNYQHATEKLRAAGVLKPDEDLVRTPALAMRPDVAAAVMIHGMVDGWFTGHKLGDYFNAHTTDWRHARRIINGMDCAEKISRESQAFYAALKST